LVKAAEVTCELGDLGCVQVEPVTSRYCRAARVWNDLMDRYHYLGRGRVCGAQIRYMVSSPQCGYLGAVGFCSATWSLQKRDEQIGWSDAAHYANVQRVVCNSRFLIVPTVRVPNLASHVLGRCAARIADDWKTRYGIEPVLLETFVDPQRSAGVSYRAANWVYVGQTSGRRAAQNGQGPKDIFICPLCTRWRSILQNAPGVQPADKPCPADAADWVEEEFGTVEFYDPRLSRRLFTVVRDFYRQPHASITQACNGSVAKAKAVYRFLQNPRVCMERILRPHVESTAGRIKNHKVVLAVQDTADLDRTGHPALGTGPLNTSEDKAVGLKLHDTMAFTPEGTPLGLLDVQYWVSDPKEVGKSRDRRQLSIEPEESMKWIRSYLAVSEVQKLCPRTRLVSIGDCEANIYELFLEASKNPEGPDLLVRCARSRKRRAGQVDFWVRMNKEPVSGVRVVHVPRKDTLPARDATLEVRHARVTLKPLKDKEYPPLHLWIVHAKEVPYGSEVASPLDWMLLTTVEVNDCEDACERLDWYTKRWGIEVYHGNLKAVGRFGDRRLGMAEGLEVCLAMDMVVAWRTYHVAILAR